MAAQGFSRTIESDDGSVYWLPPAEYNFQGSTTSDQVHARARTAAGSVDNAFAVLVTESVGRKWSGLRVKI
jgi:hypothetical protein